MAFGRGDAARVADILREAAAAEIMPRFRNLAAGAIREKTGALDLVTDADEAAERRIEAALLRAFPGALVIGEEAVSRDPSRLDGIDGAELAFILDPVDGTLNFASGLPLFGLIAAVTVRGETVCGVILDPVVEDWAMALRGEGAWIERPDGRTEDLRVAAPAPVEALHGNISWRYLPDDMRAAVPGRFPRFAACPDLRCAAHTYRLVAGGHLHFAFSSSVKPWDHAAGVLIHAEAGGHTAHFDGRPYRPANLGGGLICAPDRETWAAVRGALLE